MVSAAAVAGDDEKLAKLKLPSNDLCQEGGTLTEAEEKKLATDIVSKLSVRRRPSSREGGGKKKRTPKIVARRQNPEATMANFDETSRIRIYRGMITNNKGTDKERVDEAIEMYTRCSDFFATNTDILTKPLKGEAVMDACMNTKFGGLDFYGHQVWAEQLGDIAAVVDHPVTPEEANKIRLKTMEAVRAAQTRACEARGPRRYKQVYIIDLSQLSLSSLMARSAVRTMTTEIIKGANAYYPETLWKLFIVNAPFIFRSVYSIISPFIHPVTKEKIKILGGPSKYLPELLKEGVPKSAVPKFLGGDHPDVGLHAMIADLVKDGYPRAAQAPQPERAVEEAEPEVPATPAACA